MRPWQRVVSFRPDFYPRGMWIAPIRFADSSHAHADGGFAGSRRRVIERAALVLQKSAQFYASDSVERGF